MVITDNKNYDIPIVADAKIEILKTKWYPEQVNSMVDKCVELLKIGGCKAPIIHSIPGALELPLAAQFLSRKHLSKNDQISNNSSLEAIICFGAILKGETYHFEMIADECIRGLGQVMRNEDIPIIVEVLPVYSMNELIARSSNDQYNKGIEAAYAALEIVKWRRSL
jgi:6,7-dimethyl-8-ribityllumazine synthase